MNIQEILSSLAKRRPIFHNEADFQHALAWEIHEQIGGSIRLERRVEIANQRMYLDIWHSIGDHTTAIELKYKSKSLENTNDGERFSLITQGAQDIGRYDILKDLYRIERMVSEGIVNEGYLVCLSNDSLLFRDPGEEKQTMDRDFRIHEGRRVTGTLQWAIHTGQGTMKGRESAIEIAGDYEFYWLPYSKINSSPQGTFRVLVVKSAVPILRKQLIPTTSQLQFHQVEAPRAIEEPNTSNINSNGLPDWFKHFISTQQIMNSQVDFRNRLATSLKQQGYNITLDRNLGNFKIDIWSEKDGEQLAIEVRYKTTLLDTIFRGETIKLKNQGAQDISRYEYLNDLYKLEKLVRQRPGVSGFAILITNDHLYWNYPKNSNSVDQDFHIYNNRYLQGSLQWGETTSWGTKGGREKPIELQGKYLLKWYPHIRVDQVKNGEFKVLLVETNSNA